MKFILISILIVSSTFCASQDVEFEVSTPSSIIINGQTNVSEFHCISKEQQIFGRVAINDKSGIMIFRNSIVIPVKSFNCENPIMTSDFKKLLNEDIHPEIFLTFDTLKIQNKKGINFGSGTLKIAGIENRYRFNFNVSIEDNRSLIEGTKIIEISDFNIEPPTRLFGLVKVENTISIDYKFYLK